MLKVMKIAIIIFAFFYVTKMYGKSGFTLPNDGSQIQTILQLQMTPSKNSYKIGEYLSLQIQSNKDCYLTVIDIGTSGQTNILFPNVYQQNNLLKANKVLKIPNNKFDLEIGKPVGEEVFWAVCRVENKPLLSRAFNFDSHAFHPLPKITDIQQLPNVNSQYFSKTENRKKISIKVH